MPLVGFEKDDYVANGNTQIRSLEPLSEEYRGVRFNYSSLYKF
jgi:hypothetical protein